MHRDLVVLFVIEYKQKAHSFNYVDLEYLD